MNLYKVLFFIGLRTIPSIILRNLPDHHDGGAGDPGHISLALRILADLLCVAARRARESGRSGRRHAIPPAMTDSPSPPNLYSFATTELSQDATVA